ncbi:MAG: spermidine synthase, partial [Desulfosalsimonas sp.]
HAAEDALARCALDLLGGGKWDVAVGGLGLGYTAAAALEFKQVRHLVVIESLAPVIDWHNRNLLPASETLTGDPRCILHHADFFELARGCGFDPEAAGRRFDAILLDIDHSPDSVLNDGHREFYTTAGIQRLLSFLKPGGVFALWSNDPPQAGFIHMLSGVFARAEGRVIEFENPLQGSVSANGIYIAVA